MKIKKIAFFRIPNCYELSIGKQKLVVTTEFGPRILHLSIGKSGNILFVDEKRECKYKDWFLYGGHRLWTSPETGATYNPDNERCLIAEKEGALSVTHFDRKLEFSRTMNFSEQNGRFCVEHVIENKSEVLFPGAIWALTCVVPKGIAFFPWGTPDEWKIKKAVYWQKWMTHGSDPASKQWVQGPDLFMVKPTGEEGKVGTAGWEGFIGITNSNYTFIKKFDRLPTNDYPDDNCAIQCYTCNKFIELETLSPNTVFRPNVPVRHKEEWILVDKQTNPENGAEIRRLL